MQVTIERKYWLERAVKDYTFQDDFPQQGVCDNCHHRTIPVMSIVDDEGLLASAINRPNLSTDEFWYHDSVAIILYQCVNPSCGKMFALWNQA